MSEGGRFQSSTDGDVCFDHVYGGEYTPRRWDRTIGALAERQHGVVARRQLLGVGMGKRAIEVRLARGSLHLVHRGVYAVGHPTLTRTGRWMAAVLASGRGAVLSHLTAGQLWRIVPPRSSELEVTRPGFSGKRPHILAHRSSLPDDERTVRDRIPVTSLPRTILDLAGVLGREPLERAIDEADALGLTDRLSVPELLDRHPGRRGSAALRAIFGDRNTGRGVTVNEFEAAFAKLVAAHRLPPPRYNADLAVRGRFIRPDAMWERQKLIVELDGRAVHGTRLAFERDRERDRLLTLDGWRIVRVTWLQLREAPERVAADLGELLGRAAASTLSA